MPAHDLSFFPALTQTASGRIHVLPRPASWDAIDILADRSGDALGLIASRRIGTTLEVAVRPVADVDGRLDGRAMGGAIERFLRATWDAPRSPALLTAHVFSTGKELARCTPTPGGIRALAWRLTLRALAEVNSAP